MLAPMRVRINGQITAIQVKVISEDNAELGVFSLTEALKLVGSRREDLVEIEPDSNPPVCQAIDYGKYQYRWLQAEKKRRGL